MTELVIFPDPLLAVLDTIRAAPGPAEFSELTFGTKTPAELGDDFPGVPYVAFSLIYTDPSNYPFFERATVRISVWAENDAKGLRLCQLVRAVLVAADGPHGSITPSTGPFQTKDPDTENPLSYADVVIRLRPAIA